MGFYVALVDAERCNVCGTCVDICPLDLIEIKDGRAVVSDGCMGCGACITDC